MTVEHRLGRTRTCLNRSECESFLKNAGSPDRPVSSSHFLQARGSQGIDATLHREGGVDTRESEETEEEAARLFGFGDFFFEQDLLRCRAALHHLEVALHRVDADFVRMGPVAAASEHAVAVDGVVVRGVIR